MRKSLDGHCRFCFQVRGRGTSRYLPYIHGTNVLVKEVVPWGKVLTVVVDFVSRRAAAAHRAISLYCAIIVLWSMFSSPHAFHSCEYVHVVHSSIECSHSGTAEFLLPLSVAYCPWLCFACF